MDYGLAQLLVRTDHKKKNGSLRKDNSDGSAVIIWKLFLVYSKLLCVQNTFYLYGNEISISGLRITRKNNNNNNNMSSSHVLHATSKHEQVISSRWLEENGREMS